MKRGLGALIVLLILATAQVALAQVPQYLDTWTGFVRPWGIAFDLSGNVYVTEIGASRISVHSPAGLRLFEFTYTGNEAQGTFLPLRIAVSPDGSVFVTDPNLWPTSGLLRFALDGTYLGQVGSKGVAPGQLNGPEAVAVNETGHLLVTDDGNNRVQMYDESGAHVAVWGTLGTGPSQFTYPSGIAIGPDGTVYVSDADQQRIQAFAPNGTYLREWGSPGTGPGEFQGAEGLAVDAEGVVYVADRVNHRIQAFSGHGEFLFSWGSHGTAPGQFDRPVAVAVSPDGRIFVADTWNSRIQTFAITPTAVRTTTWGRVKALYR